MDMMFQAGFLGTRAPFFMDLVTLIVSVLPLLVGIAISFVKKENYTLHGRLQTLIFIISVLIVGYFEYGVRLGGGYEAFVKETHVSHDYLFIVLVIHIIISVLTLGTWISTLLKARKDYERGLPGPYSRSHRKAGLRTFAGIVLTSLTGIWVYLLLFVF
jgi:putative membrane protein